VILGRNGISIILPRQVEPGKVNYTVFVINDHLKAQGNKSRICLYNGNTAAAGVEFVFSTGKQTLSP
jgi:hypothetical protein